MKAKLFAIATSALALTACAELNSIHRVSTVPGSEPPPRVITVDAKQRHLIFNPEAATVAGGQTKWRVCAEAAPDVFSAFASSLGGSLGVEEKSARAQFSSAIAESAATIERTQTINLIRESFYRSCERYLSGAVDRTQFIVQSSRDHRAMVSILAIEQLTRTVRPTATIISGPATSSAIRDGEAAAKLVEQFRKDAETSASALATAKAALATANGVQNCIDNEEPPTGTDDAANTARTNYSTCMVAKTTSATRSAENKVAQDRLDQALKLAADTVTTLNASSQTGTNSSGLGGTAADSTSIAAVAKVVETITLRSGVNESLMFCIGYLTAADIPNKSVLVTESCLNILEQQAALDRTMLRGSFTDDVPGKILSDYLDRPEANSERTRRRSILISAARETGLPTDPIDLIGLLATGTADQKQRLLDAARALEADPQGKQDLTK